MTVLRRVGRALGLAGSNRRLLLLYACVIPLAAAVAAAVAALVNPRLHDISDLRTAGALIPAALAYTAVNLLLFALVMSLRTGAPFTELITSTVSGKLSVIGSNVAVGLLIVV